MQTAIASSSVSPYMWIVIGPISKKPLEGDGIEAITPRHSAVRERSSSREVTNPKGGPSGKPG
jgi:hypothetical protein